MPYLPSVTVVTPTLNQSRYLERTLASVRAQTYPRIEHFVVDGGSTDGTLEILRRAAVDHGLAWLSEPDGGMYDAINKGISRTSGEIVAYLNSDDAWLPWAAEAAVSLFARRPDVDLVYGDGIKVNEHTGVQSVRLFAPFDRVSLANAGSLMQPAVFWRRRLIERIGGFDANLRFVADLDYWLRAAEAGAGIAHLAEVVAVECMQPDRLSSVHREQMATEDLEMRSRRGGAAYTPDARTAALERDERWQRRLWLQFAAAFAARPLPGPWQRFIRGGGVAMRSRPLRDGLRAGESKRLWRAAASTLAATTIGVPTEVPPGGGWRAAVQRLRLLAIAVPRLPAATLATRAAPGRRGA